MLEKFYHFFVSNLPNTDMVMTFTLPFALWAGLSLHIFGLCKVKREWHTGMSRKSFHFVIFFSSAFIQWFWGMPTLCYFGGITSLIVFYAILRGHGCYMYEAMARENDEPFETHFIVMPWLATFLGGVIGNVLFGPYAIIGYMVVGLADAIAEPVGVRWGRHRYVSLSYGMNHCTSFRTLEGSAAIFLVSIPIFILGFMLLGLSFSWMLLAVAFLLSVVVCLVEAASPHGWDNMTLQLVASGLSFWIFN